MAAKSLTWLTAMLLSAAALLVPSLALAQPAPPASFPVQPPSSPIPVPPPPTLGAPVAAPFPVPPVPPPPPPPFLQRLDPGLNGSAGSPSGEEGLFFNTEFDFVKPAVKNRLSGTVTLPDGSTGTVQPPQASLDWTVAPRFELGYRFPDSFGDFSASYRFLTSEGTGTVGNADGAFNVRSRLDVNQLDLDYASDRFSPAPFWDLKWRIGASPGGRLFRFPRWQRFF